MKPSLAARWRPHLRMRLRSFVVLCGAGLPSYPCFPSESVRAPNGAALGGFMPAFGGPTCGIHLFKTERQVSTKPVEPCARGLLTAPGCRSIAVIAVLYDCNCGCSCTCWEVSVRQTLQGACDHMLAGWCDRWQHPSTGVTHRSVLPCSYLIFISKGGDIINWKKIVAPPRAPPPQSLAAPAP